MLKQLLEQCPQNSIPYLDHCWVERAVAGVYLFLGEGCKRLPL
jgi:hypothetical protein